MRNYTLIGKQTRSQNYLPNQLVVYTLLIRLERWVRLYDLVGKLYRMSKLSDSKLLSKNSEEMNNLKIWAYFIMN
jgi:hypothetical protein